MYLLLVFMDHMLLVAQVNGGMFLTNNQNYYEKAKVLRSWGRMSTLIKDSENINKRLNIKF